MFRLEKENEEIKYRILRDIRNLFRLEKKAIEDLILRDIWNLFKHDEEKNCYKPVKVSNFWSNKYMEYGCKCDRIKHHQLKKILIKLDIFKRH